MPPRTHSSSSRSSSSSSSRSSSFSSRSSRSSSSRSSSSRSSSSRSSGSFLFGSRSSGPSSRSKSSRSQSSASRSSVSGGSRSAPSRGPSSHSSRSAGLGFGLLGGSLASRGPSRHSSTSRYSTPTRERSEPAVNARPRFHQPSGFRGPVRPTYHYGRRHDYIFYPVSWIDESTGTSYEKGYYDENGTRYDNVSFEKDGKFENVVCHCSYCGQDTILNLSSEEVSGMSLKCPSCNGPMDIVSELDEYMESRAAAKSPYGYDSDTYSSGRTRRLPRRLILILLLFVIFSAGFRFLHWLVSSPTDETGSGNISVGGSNGVNQPATPLLSEDTIGLAKIGDHVYVEDNRASDKVLVWDEGADSYYDEASDCWLWYNEDVNPPLWQYWYEGISSDYGDYGWMEHYDDGWFIEASEGNWIALPDRYDSSSLWYIEN